MDKKKICKTHIIKKPMGIRKFINMNFSLSKIFQNSSNLKKYTKKPLKKQSLTLFL